VGAPEVAVDKALVSVKAIQEIIMEMEIVQIKISKERVKRDQEKVGMVHLQEALQKKRNMRKYSHPNLEDKGKVHK
jgi:hypothetical protein